MYQMELSADEREIVLKAREAERLVGGYCEDYPCCGHTPEDPCTREWYDHPDAFDTRRNPHALCNHEDGDCDVQPDDYDDDPDNESEEDSDE